MRTFLFTSVLLLTFAVTLAVAAETANPPDRAGSPPPSPAPVSAASQPGETKAPAAEPPSTPPTAAPEKNATAPAPGKEIPAKNKERAEQSAAPQGAKPAGQDAAAQRRQESASATPPLLIPPPLLAGVVNERALAFQRASLYLNIFPFLKRLRQVSAYPPLLHGIAHKQFTASPERTEPQVVFRSMLTRKLIQQEERQKSSDTLGTLTALLTLQKNIKQQMAVLAGKQATSTSDSEKQAIQEDMAKLDKQMTDAAADFERTATGISPKVFDDKEKTQFSWKDEITVLLEPSIKELKSLTARARQRSELKEVIGGYERQLAEARNAVAHLNKLLSETGDPDVEAYLNELLPAWQNVAKRIDGKLDLARKELIKLEAKNVGPPKSTEQLTREFFHQRTWYVMLSLLVFIAIFLVLRLLGRLLFAIIPGARKEQRPIHVRILDIFFKIFPIFAAIGGLIFVLYLTEDWFLLSLALIILLGIVWALRQTLPKMWKHVRIVLNMGSIREGERVLYNGVAWRVEALNVFCKLHNPALGVTLRIPIENMIGLISRPYHLDEPWFPCKRGDWVAIDGKPLGKVVSLSHEQVEVVESGGCATVYQTSVFLGKAPANLSRNFSIRVVLGLSYDLQAEITTTVLTTLHDFVQKKLEEHGYAEKCLNLTVDFLQAASSSLNVAIMADFKGELASACRRLERALAKWSVDCCTVHGWEMPFPQMSVHLAKENDA